MSEKTGRRVLKTKNSDGCGMPALMVSRINSPLRTAGKIVALVPAQRLMLDAEVVEAALERLEMPVGLAVEVEPHLVEIPQAAIGRQIAAPVIRVARHRHAGTWPHRGDAVGAGADRS